jgi:DNA-binding SARP family transcriptional activator
MKGYFKRLSIKKKLSEKQLESAIKRLFELHPKMAFSYKRLIKLYGQHGEEKVQKILTCLLAQEFLFKFRYGINSIYVKNPFKR